MNVVATQVNRTDLSEFLEDDRLGRLDQEFLNRLRIDAPDLHRRLLAYREHQPQAPYEVSELLVGCAAALERFIGELFGVEAELDAVRGEALSHDPVLAFKRHFVQERARVDPACKSARGSYAELDHWLEARLAEQGLELCDKELAVARFAEKLLTERGADAQDLEKLTRWCMLALTTPEGRAAVQSWVSFRLPQPRDGAGRVPLEAVAAFPDALLEGAGSRRYRRDGFRLVDRRMGVREIQNETDYCAYCHGHESDYCSRGFAAQRDAPDAGQFKTNSDRVLLTGCPLGQRISEMHLLKREGRAIAALAMVMADNPMCAATGHRICNDCVTACVYQDQDAVNTPQVETRVLADVLALPWGVEIYCLLIRWNPLRARQWLPKPYNGLKVLVCGMGPAGFTLAHHLLMEGFAVVGIDGVKVEPLPREWIERPIRDYASVEESLDERMAFGLGGVAEYGITSRWDKNFLKLIHLSLARRPHFQVFGGVRFGGTVTVEEAWRLGFDHLAIAVGAGLSEALPLPGSLAPGMRQATDFLMTLHLSGAAKRSSLSNLQVRLPAVVIGGGLTAVDAATEVQAYYVLQVEKTLERYETLTAEWGESGVRSGLDEASLRILDEYLAHGRLVRAERERARRAGEPPDFLPLLRRWGGVTIAYRRALHESPAYTRNHEELIAALEEGVCYAEGLEPSEALLDEYGHVQAMVFRRLVRGTDGRWSASTEEVSLPARAVLVATGSRPNVAYEFEHRGHFLKDGQYYQGHRLVAGKLETAPVPPHCKAEGFGPFTSYQQDGRCVSFIGDTHPAFNGSVVKAMASAQRSYPQIVEALQHRLKEPGDAREYQEFEHRIQRAFEARLVRVVRHNPRVVELSVHAPLAARRFQPGQFFRLQIFQTKGSTVRGTSLQPEAIALTGADADAKTGCISLFLIGSGASTRLCSGLKAGDRVSLMGPTGTPTKIPQGETVMIVTSEIGVPHIMGVGPAMRANGNRVLHFALFDDTSHVHSQGAIEQAADVTVWCSAQGTPPTPRRAQDRAAAGDVLEAIKAYAEGRLYGGEPPISLRDVDRLILIGDSGMVRRLRDARDGELQEYFGKKPETIGSVGTPMLCMLKGVCAQCLQWQIDPETGKRTKAVFACSWQDEPLDIVDLDNLCDRQAQNRLQEHLAGRWLDYLSL